VRRGLLLQQLLELGLLLRVEQPLGRAGGPVLLHPDRVVAVEAVGRDRRRVDEAARPGVGGRAERVERALDVDRPRGLAVAADDEEGQVHHDVGAAEGLTQRVDVADVAAAVLHLRPAVLVRVEGPPAMPTTRATRSSCCSSGTRPKPKVPVGPVTATVRSCALGVVTVARYPP
jgi:hypothetical protein